MAMGLAFQLISILLISSISRAQQGYGLSYPPQLFYLAPNDAAVVLAQHAATLAPTPTRKMIPPDAGEDETAQFQTHDGKGHSVFGFLAPDQSRVEERGKDGSVRGAYSYLDPDGRAVKVQYWDSGSGFHSAGNNLPAVMHGLPQPVQDTPEVQMAKEQHLKFFQQTLLHHQQQLEAAGNTEASTTSEQPKAEVSTEKDEAEIQKFLLEQQKHQQQQLQQIEALGSLTDNGLLGSGVASDSVVVESDNSNIPNYDDSELTRYPNLEKFPQNLYDPTQIHDTNRDAVIVESSEGTSNNVRSGKSVNIDSKEDKPLSDNKNTANIAKIEEEKSDLKPVESKLDEKTVLSKEGEKKIEPMKNMGFFYSFHHPIPVYVQVQTVSGNEDSGKSEYISPEPLSHSEKAAYFGALPISAVHDFQVPPWQKDKFNNINLPLYTAPFSQRNTESIKPLSYSQKATFYGAIPVAAVHDQQVHPNQKGSVPDHQTAPVYIETSVEEN